jgi:hypothetical protein
MSHAPQSQNQANLSAGKSSLTENARSDHAPEQESRGIIMERTLHVNITNSLGNLALAGPHGGIWKPVDGLQTKIFANLDSDVVDASAATTQLNCAVIHKVTLLEHQSTFPVPLGVEINCVPSREVTELGQKFAYTVLPHSVNSNSNTIYEAEMLNDEMYAWHKEFPMYNASNLDSEGVIPIPNSPYVFIDCNHPVVSLLRHNSHLIGCDIDSQKKIEEKYFRISTQVLQCCCDTLRRKVLSKVTSHDLNTLSLQIHRINADGWEDLQDGTVAMRSFKIKSELSPEEVEIAQRKHLKNFVSTPYTYMARIRIRYELPST